MNKALDGLPGLPKAHLAINVRSVERSVEFYKKMFGLNPSKHHAGYAKFDVESPPLNLTLNERPFTDSGALFHMGIQVGSTDEVLRMREKWSTSGLATRDEMGIVCGYALQDKSWVTDPDGNQWEVFVVNKDNLPTYYGEGDSCSAASASCSANSTTEQPSSGCSSTAADNAINDQSVRITSASPSDLNEVLALLSAVNLPHDGVKEHLASFLLMRDAQERLIGCAGLERYEGVGLLRSVAVVPNLQNSGAGSRLIASMIERARSADLKELVLLTTTAHDFFVQRFGFVDADRTEYEQILAQSPEWTLPRCSSAAFMRLDLSPDANA